MSSGTNTGSANNALPSQASRTFDSPESRALYDYFGPPLRLNNPVAKHRSPRQLKSFLEAYEGNIPLMGDTLTGLTTSDNDPATSILVPYMRSDNPNMRFTKFHFNRALPTQVPSLGVSRLITSSQSSKDFMQDRYGIGWYMEADLLMSPEGKRQYLLNNVTITQACREAAVFSAYNELMLSSTFMQEFQAVQKETTGSVLRAMLQLEYDTFAAACRADALDSVIRIGVDTLKKRGVVPDVVILWPTAKTYLSTELLAARANYAQFGPAGQYLFVQGPEGMRVFDDLLVIETRDFDIGTSGPRHQPLMREVEFGEVYPMLYDPELTAKQRSIWIYDYENDEFVEITLEEAFLNCGIWDNAGVILPKAVPFQAHLGQIFSSFASSSSSAGALKRASVRGTWSTPLVSSASAASLLARAMEPAQFCSVMLYGTPNVYSNSIDVQAGETKLTKFASKLEGTSGENPEISARLKMLLSLRTALANGASAAVMEKRCEKVRALVDKAIKADGDFSKAYDAGSFSSELKAAIKEADAAPSQATQEGAVLADFAGNALAINPTAMINGQRATDVLTTLPVSANTQDTANTITSFMTAQANIHQFLLACGRTVGGVEFDSQAPNAWLAAVKSAGALPAQMHDKVTEVVSTYASAHSALESLVGTALLGAKLTGYEEGIKKIKGVAVDKDGKAIDSSAVLTSIQNNDKNIPVAFLIFRLAIRFTTFSPVIMKSGASTAVTAHGMADFALTYDGATKAVLGNYTYYFGTFVISPENIYIVRDACPRTQEGGWGTRWFDPHQIREQLKLDRVQRPSLLSCIVPVSLQKNELMYPLSVVPSSSYFTAPVHTNDGKSMNQQIVNDAVYDIPTAELYKEITGLESSLLSKVSNDSFYTQFDAANTVAARGVHYAYNKAAAPGSNNMWKYVSGTGHLSGVRTQRGVRLVFQGKEAKLPNTLPPEYL